MTEPTDRELIAEADRLAKKEWIGDGDWSDTFAPILIRLIRSGWTGTPGIAADPAEELAWQLSDRDSFNLDTKCAWREQVAPLIRRLLAEAEQRGREAISIPEDVLAAADNWRYYGENDPGRMARFILSLHKEAE